MGDWDDQTQWNEMAKKVYDLIEEQWRRINRASSSVDSGGHHDTAIQAFLLERKRAIQLLDEWFGPDHVADFERFPCNFLNMHPAFLSSNYLYRDGAKAEAQKHAAFLFALLQDVKYRPLSLNGTKVRDAYRSILEVFVNASESPDANASLGTLINEHGFVMDELIFYLDDLKKRGLLKEIKLEYFVTPTGLKELKRMENEEPETPEQKRFRVLKTLYDLAPMTSMVRLWSTRWQKR